MSDQFAIVQSIRATGCNGGSQPLCIQLYHRDGDSSVDLEAASGSTIYILNTLDNGPDAEFYFHESKGGAIITDYCGPGTGSPIVVGPGSANAYACQVADNDTGANISAEYIVKAARHIDLDPVIIIKPALAAVLPDPKSPFDSALIGIVGGLVVGLLIGVWWAKR